MPSRTAHKQKPKRPFSSKKNAGHAKAAAHSKFSRKIKKGNPDILVKKATYPKAARYAVLANAEARQKLIEMGGENTINIIREFDRDMSDEELARKTEIKASDVRVVLNRLHSQGLFSYTRVRDKDSGWYTYIWKLSGERLKEFVEAFLPEQGGEATTSIEGDAYFCPTCAPAKLVAFDEASDAQFKCSGCGGSMEFFEKKRR